MPRGDGKYNLCKARDRAIQHLSDDDGVSIVHPDTRRYAVTDDVIGVLKRCPEIAARCSGGEQISPYYIRIEDGVAHVTRRHSDTKSYPLDDAYVQSLLAEYDTELVWYEPLTCAFGGNGNE